MDNIHNPNNLPIDAYIFDSLNNALTNGDDKFLYSLEVRDSKTLTEDISECDAGVERYLEINDWSDEAQKAVYNAVDDWVQRYPSNKNS